MTCKDHKILTVAYYTFQALLKSRVLFHIILIGLLLLFISFVAGEFAFGIAERVVLDFGLGTLSLSTMAISILMGAGLISDEIESRTIYMTLSRPISRVSFLLGKSLGMGFLLISNVVISSSLTLGFYIYLGGELNPLIFWNILYTILEALICLFIVMLFSLVANKALSVIFTFFLYLSGHAVNDEFIEKFSLSSPMGFLLEKYHYLFPGFHKLNIKNFLLYQKDLEFNFLLKTLGYGFFYLLALVLLVCFVFERKDLD
ncbi:MAG: ABC transporter permease subunit [Bacteriovoracales bacterium]|nr:ABC transporter permease subunit [Bacteriovoracales bacterium]